MKFSNYPLVTAALFQSESAYGERFVQEWKRDTSVYVRVFRRTVRAGGVSLPAEVIVVRRKA
jgi:hypothetical protein